MFKSIKKAALAAAIALMSMGCAVSAYAERIQMNLVYDGVSHAYNEEEIKIVLDGKEITNLDVPAVSINSRTMVPARAIFETAGAEVVWNEETKEVYIIQDSDIVTLKIDSNVGLINGTQFTMDTPAKIVNDRTLIPVRAAAEALNYKVGWDDATRVVTLSKDGSTSSGNTNNNSQTGTTAPTATSIKVNSITVPASNSADAVFEIKASDVITKYESYMLDNTRLVIDIYNADMAVSNTNITSTNCGAVTAVRTAQFQVTPEKITRVVFDLAGNVKNEVKLSSDKKSITVKFETNDIYDVKLSKSGSSELLEVYGNTTPVLNVSYAGNPLRLVIDIPNAASSLDKTINVSSDYIDEITTSTVNGNTVRLEAKLDDNVSYEVVTENGYAAVKISKSTLDNISYDVRKHVLELDEIGNISSSNIEVFDDYATGIYTIYLPGDYSDVYGEGVLFIDDDTYISKINVGLENGKTVIELTKKKEISIHTREYMDYMQFEISTVELTGEKVVVIDAGHGLQDNGTSGNGIIEKDINLDIAKRLYNLLEADENIKVYATRLDDSYPTNISRAQLANEVGADLFISIHHNAATSTSANGTEVLYAIHEGETSGLTSKIAAETLVKYVVNALGTTNRGAVLRNDLIVLNQTKVPAVLVEVCFLSNSNDAALIKQDKNKDAVAQALYSGIVDLLAQYD